MKPTSIASLPSRISRAVEVAEEVLQDDNACRATRLEASSFLRQELQRLEADARPTVGESFRELTARLTLTPEEEGVVRVARIAASPADELLLAIIDRLTGRETPTHEPEPEPEWVDTAAAAREQAERLQKLWPLPYRPGATEEP